MVIMTYISLVSGEKNCDSLTSRRMRAIICSFRKLEREKKRNGGKRGFIGALIRTSRLIAAYSYRE